MANPFAVLTEKQAHKLLERIYMGTDDFMNELSGLAGEVAMRSAQTRREYHMRDRLHQALAALLVMIELYVYTEEDVPEYVLEHAREYVNKIREQCEMGENPSLLPDEKGYADQWGG